MTRDVGDERDARGDDEGICGEARAGDAPGARAAPVVLATAEPARRRRLARAFEDEGYDVQGVAVGDALVEWVGPARRRRASAPDLLLLEAELRCVGNEEARDALRRLDPSLPVVLLASGARPSGVVLVEEATDLPALLGRALSAWSAAWRRPRRGL